MIIKRNFTLTGSNDTAIDYFAEIIIESSKLEVTLKKSAGGMVEIFEVFNEGKEIVVRPYSKSIILRSDTELYKLLQHIGEEYL